MEDHFFHHAFKFACRCGRAVSVLLIAEHSWGWMLWVRQAESAEIPPLIRLQSRKAAIQPVAVARGRRSPRRGRPFSLWITTNTNSVEVALRRAGARLDPESDVLARVGKFVHA